MYESTKRKLKVVIRQTKHITAALKSPTVDSDCSSQSSQSSYECPKITISPPLPITTASCAVLASANQVNSPCNITNSWGVMNIYESREDDDEEEEDEEEEQPEKVCQRTRDDSSRKQLEKLQIYI